MGKYKSTMANPLILGGVQRIVFMPWEKGEDGEWKKSETGYALDNIVADTTSITQDEPETNAIDCETRDEPIYENITLGSYQFSAESGDISKEILETVLGYTVKGTGTTLRAFAPATYAERWGEIEIQFSNKTSLVVPKLKMSASIDASSLKTGIVRGIIKGTAYSVPAVDASGSEVTDEDGNKVYTPFYASGSWIHTEDTGA